MLDWVLYLSLKGCVAVLRLAPLGFWLFCARCSARVFSYFPSRAKWKAFLNLKIAFGDRPERELKRIIRKMQENFAQNLVEALYLPHMDKKRILSCVDIPQKEAVFQALSQNQGVLLLGFHAGSWELSNIACALLFDQVRYAMLSQPQKKFKRLNAYLESLREKFHCRVIRVGEAKKMVEHLNEGNILGLVADHGGREGVPIEFFGKLALTPEGSIKLSRKLGSKIILVFMRRIEASRHELLLFPFDLAKTGDLVFDIEQNLRAMNRVFEEWIRRYPEEYLWSYKRWKNSPQKDVLILSDAKAGHLNQSLALASLMEQAGFVVRSRLVEVVYRSLLLKNLLIVICFLFGSRAAWSIAGLCLRRDVWQKLRDFSYDAVVSAGSTLPALNLALSERLKAKSFVIMKPGIFGLGRFDCVIMPEHDSPALRPEVVTIEGSLNNVTADSVALDFKEASGKFSFLKDWTHRGEPKIGLLIGGHSKSYFLTQEMVGFLAQEIKRFLEASDGYVFVTTSRRTPEEVVKVLREEFDGYPRCAFFVDAARDNPKGSLGAILHLSDCAIVTGESISMVSEAAAVCPQVVVFEPRRKTPGKNKVRTFLFSLAKKRCIDLITLNQLFDHLTHILSHRPPRAPLRGREKVLARLKEMF